MSYPHKEFTQAIIDLAESMLSPLGHTIKNGIITFDLEDGSTVDLTVPHIHIAESPSNVDLSHTENWP